VTDIYLKEGDLAKAIEFVVEDDTIDFTGATVAFNMRDEGGTQVVSNAAATIETEAYQGGTRSFLRRRPVAPDVVTTGRFDGEFVVTFSDTKTGRFPDRGYISILIGAHLDP